MKKLLVVGIIVLFIGVGVQPALANDITISILDDTTPPVTAHSLNPPEPDGLNGWYVSDVNVTLTATDDMSGVKEIKYNVDGGPTHTINGDIGTFTLTQEDDSWDLQVEYWAIDNIGNEETPNIFYIDIDQTKPTIDLVFEVVGGNPNEGWEFLFTATACDTTSGMERVEFYDEEGLQDTVYGLGPTYEWSSLYNEFPDNTYDVFGLIFNPKITDEYVKFFALIVIVSENWGTHPDYYVYAYDIAGNSAYDCIEHPLQTKTIESGIFLFKSFTLPNSYTGSIDKFFINAEFYII